MKQTLLYYYRRKSKSSARRGNVDFPSQTIAIDRTHGKVEEPFYFFSTTSTHPGTFRHLQLYNFACEMTTMYFQLQRLYVPD